MKRRTGHEIEIDKVYPRQLAEKDAEIERLKAENARLKKWNLMTDEQVVMDLKAEIERLLTKSEKDKNTLLVSLEASTKEIERWKETALAWREQTEKRDHLIAELAETLEKANPTDRYKTLIQRAREVTK